MLTFPIYYSCYYLRCSFLFDLVFSFIPFLLHLSVGCSWCIHSFSFCRIGIWILCVDTSHYFKYVYTLYLHICAYFFLFCLRFGFCFSLYILHRNICRKLRVDQRRTKKSRLYNNIKQYIYNIIELWRMPTSTSTTRLCTKIN